MPVRPEAPSSLAVPRGPARIDLDWDALEIAAGLVSFREDVRNTVTEFIVERRKAGFM